MTDRQAQYRESKAKARKAKRAAGLAPLEVWAKPSDHAAIRAFVAALVEGNSPVGAQLVKVK